MIKTGIYGGTFNPIHFGHIRLAKLLLERAGLDEVWFMVTPQNPFKVNQELVWDRYRYEMVEGALRRYKRLIASDFEFRLPKPSFTWRHCRKTIPTVSSLSSSVVTTGRRSVCGTVMRISSPTTMWWSIPVRVVLLI